MKIGILGAGMMTTSLARKWQQAGHEIMISARDTEKATALANSLGTKSGDFTEAVAYADVLLIAVRYEGVMTTLAAAGASKGAFANKVLIDCSNPVETEGFTLVGNEHDSMAERIQNTATGVKVVKAFNLCQAKVWEMDTPQFDGRTLVVPYCSDDSAAKQVAQTLIRDVGCQPMDMGQLYFARHLEAMAALVISLLFTGYDPLSVFNFITPDPSDIRS